jgi:hypothetical protein
MGDTLASLREGLKDIAQHILDDNAEALDRRLNVLYELKKLLLADDPDALDRSIGEKVRPAGQISSISEQWPLESAISIL